jgi:hypothetical protein
MRAMNVDKQVISRYLLQIPIMYGSRGRMSVISKQLNNHFDEITFKMNMTVDSCERMPNIPAENILVYSNGFKKTVDSNAVH